MLISVIILNILNLYYFRAECHVYRPLHTKSKDSKSTVMESTTSKTSKQQFNLQSKPVKDSNFQLQLPKFNKRCNELCSCTLKNHDSGMKTVKCKSFQRVKQLMEEFSEQDLQPLDLTIQDSRVQNVYGNCGVDLDSNGTICFALKRHFSFKAVRSLTLKDLPRAQEIGNRDSDFFSLMPNLKSLVLKLKSKQKSVVVYFTYAAQSIQNLSFVLSRDQDLQIGCSSMSCFKLSISSFSVSYAGNSSLSFLPDAKVPHSIKDLRIKFNQYTTIGKHFNQNIFADIKAKTISLDIEDELAESLAMNLTDVSVKKKFVLKWKSKAQYRKWKIADSSEYYPAMLYSQLYRIYQNYKLSRKLVVKSYWATYFPAIVAASTNKDNIFKKTFFDTCKLTKEILELKNTTVGRTYGNEKKLLIRAIHYDLSTIVRNSLFKEFNEIVVTAYSVTISETFIVPDDKLLTVYYFQLGSDSITSGDDQEFHSVLLDLKNNQRFSLDKLSVKAISFKHAKHIDPIFTRAIALCVTQNVGAFQKRMAGETPHVQITSKEFWKVNNFIPTKITFEKEYYTIREQAGAWEALRNMNMYIGIIMENNNHLIRTSDIFLKSFDEGNFIFSRYAKKLNQLTSTAGEHAIAATGTSAATTTSSSTTNEYFPVIEESTATSTTSNSASNEKKESLRSMLWISLDHSYHVISALRRKVRHVIDAHTDNKILFDDLILKFNTYKAEVQENSKRFTKIVKETNSFQTSKIVTGIVNATLQLFEDENHFEKIVKDLLEDWAPLKTKTIIETLQELRKLVVNLDSISVLSTKLRKAIETNERRFEKYVDGVCKILSRIILKINHAKVLSNKQKKHSKRLREITARLNSLKEELLWPDQIVKAILDIDKAIRIGTKLSGKYLKFFKLIPDPYQHFIPNKEYNLYTKAIKTDVDHVRKWAAMRKWLSQVLNSTSATYMIKKVEVRYPLLNLIDVAEQITQLMVSEHAYQVNAIDAQLSYLTYYFKAIGTRLKLEKMTKNDNDENDQAKQLKIHLQSETTTLKLELISWISLCCKLFFYKNLQPCPVDVSTSIVDSVEDVLSTYNFITERLMVFQNTGSEGRTQKFVKQLSFSIPHYCIKCFKDIQEYQEHHFSDTNKIENAEKNKLYMVDVACAEKEWSERYSNMTQSLQSMQEIIDICLNNPFKAIEQFNSFSFTLSREDFDLIDKDDVRLNKLEISLYDGAGPVSDHAVTTYITTTGIYEAVHRSKTFQICTEPLFFEYTYRYPNNSKESAMQKLSSQLDTRSHISLPKYKVRNIKSDITRLNNSFRQFQGEVTESLASVNKEHNDPRLKRSKLKHQRSSIERIDLSNIKMVDAKSDSDFINSADLSTNVNGISFAPFGFTKWTILIPRDKNVMLDLNQITEVRAVISGAYKERE